MSRSGGITDNASRYTVRVFAVLLLLLGVVGGIYLGQDRKTRQVSASADASAQAQLVETAVLDDLLAAQDRADAQRRAAAREAAAKAAKEAAAAAERARQAEEAASRRNAQSRAASAPVGPVPASCGDYSGNRATGCTLLLDWGFSLDQMPCLDSLWTKESGWNHQAENRSSGAYGIPQALPGSKMASYGDDWRTNPATQVKWGLNYVQKRYGSPCGAWQFFQNNGWY